MHLLFNTKSPFLKVFRFKISNVRPGYYSVTAYNDADLILPTANWVPTLYFNYESLFYGVGTSLQERDLLLSAAELLDIFSPEYKHPFIDVEAGDEETATLFQSLRDTLPLWSSTSLWERAEVTEDGFTFSNELIQNAVEQKLAATGMTKADAVSLIPFFKNGGWPMQGSRSLDGVKVSLRLSEPEENAENWLLETILTGAGSAKHWTPSVRKLSTPISLALPKKWLHLATQIEEMQQQIIELIQLNAPDSNFIHLELSDLAVRDFLRKDLAKLQAMGFDVILPAWLKELKQSKMRVRVNANNQSTRSVAGLDDILTFKWQFSMNGEDISAEQFRKLVEEKREFVRIGTEWFRMDAEWLNEMRTLWNRQMKKIGPCVIYYSVSFLKHSLDHLKKTIQMMPSVMIPCLRLKCSNHSSTISGSFKIKKVFPLYQYQQCFMPIYVLIRKKALNGSFSCAISNLALALLMTWGLGKRFN